MKAKQALQHTQVPVFRYAHPGGDFGPLPGSAVSRMTQAIPLDAFDGVESPKAMGLLFAQQRAHVVVVHGLAKDLYRSKRMFCLVRTLDFRKRAQNETLEYIAQIANDQWVDYIVGAADQFASSWLFPLHAQVPHADLFCIHCAEAGEKSPKDLALPPGTTMLTVNRLDALSKFLLDAMAGRLIIPASLPNGLLLAGSLTVPGITWSGRKGSRPRYCRWSRTDDALARTAMLADIVVASASSHFGGYVVQEWVRGKAPPAKPRKSNGRVE